MNFFALFSYGPYDKFDNINKMLRLNFAHLSYIYMDFQIIKGNRILIYLDHINEFIMNVACIPCIAKMTVTYFHVHIELHTIATFMVILKLNVISWTKACQIFMFEDKTLFPNFF